MSCLHNSISSVHTTDYYTAITSKNRIYIAQENCTHCPYPLGY